MSIHSYDVFALINHIQDKLANAKEQAELHKGDDEATIALSATISTLEDVLQLTIELLDENNDDDWNRWRLPHL